MSYLNIFFRIFNDFDNCGIRVKTEDHFDSPVAAKNYDLLNVEKVAKRIRSPTPSQQQQQQRQHQLHQQQQPLKIETSFLSTRPIASLKRPSSTNVDQLINSLDTSENKHKQNPVRI